jgi:hypothetical protein
MSIFRQLSQLVISASLLICAQSALAEIVQISTHTLGGLRLDTNVAQTVSGPRATGYAGSGVNHQQTHAQQKQSSASATTNAESNRYAPSVSDAVIGSLVLLLAVGAAGGLARAQRPSVSRW